MPSLKRPKVIAFEPCTFDRTKHEATRSNPAFWKNDGVRSIFDLVYAPSYPEIEKAYQDAGKGLYRVEGEAAEQVEASTNVSTEALQEAKEDFYDSLEQVDRDPNDVSEKEPVSDAEDVSEGTATEDHWSELSWPKMRSLATTFTDEPVKSKDQAKEILAEAESAGKI